MWTAISTRTLKFGRRWLEMLARRIVSGRSGGGMHPNLVWALPFWLQTGYTDVVSGVDLVPSGSPTQDTCGMIFSENKLTFPEPEHYNEFSFVLSFSPNSSSLQSGLYDSKGVSLWASTQGMAIVIGTSDSRLQFTIGTQTYLVRNCVESGVMQGFAVTHAQNTAPILYKNAQVLVSEGDTPIAYTKSTKQPVVGVYYGNRYFAGCIEYMYFFDRALTQPEIDAIHSNPASVLG